jgi:ubiquinol-cytochrome c reductase cytochrome c subunit
MVKTLLMAAFIAAPFAAFSQTTGTAPAQPAGDAAHGKAVFINDGCSECHSSGAQGGTGPHLAPNPLPAAAIAAYVRHPAGVMPPYSEKVLSNSDIADIHAYLLSIPAPPKLNTIPELND